MGISNASLSTKEFKKNFKKVKIPLEYFDEITHNF
jgi:hypothetical protein